MSVTKPDMRRAWANNGAVVKPNDAIIDLGWIAEKPPYQNENWIQRRSDEFMQHTNVEGIAQWDTLTTYEISSIVKGSDGKVYVSNSNPNLNINPTTDILGNWTVAPQRASDIVDLIYPIGSIYFSVIETDPSTFLGGTWERISEGRMIVGQQAADPLFDVSEETGGSKNAIVVSHNHSAVSNGSHRHLSGSPDSQLFAQSIYGSFNTPTNYSTPSLNANQDARQAYSQTTGSHSHTINSTGSSGTNANLPPYLVAYIWKRTA